MKLWKKILLGVFSFILLSIGGLYLFIQSLPDMCGNEVLVEYPSPNKKLKAVAFQRDCGATTGFSTQVSILSNVSVLENEKGNIFIADTNHGAAPSGEGGGPEVKINWLSDAHLHIEYHQLARNFRAESVFKGVKVDYRTFQ